MLYHINMDKDEWNEKEKLRLRHIIISLEARNNRLDRRVKRLLKGKETFIPPAEEIISEEQAILASQIKFLKEDEAIRERYIEHLEDLLEFFVYHEGKCHWSVDR